MNVQIKATRLELTDRLKEYADKKANMLEKYLGDFPIMNSRFELEKTTDHHVKGEIYRAELNLEVPGELLRVEKTSEDIFKAIDKVKDHMEIVIKKYKEKKKGV